MKESAGEDPRKKTSREAGGEIGCPVGNKMGNKRYQRRGKNLNRFIDLQKRKRHGHLGD